MPRRTPRNVLAAGAALALVPFLAVPPAAAAPPVRRFAGSPAAVAERIAGAVFAGADTAVIATSADYPDALAAAAAAANLGAPVLLTSGDALDYATISRLAADPPERILLVGGPEAVGTGVERWLPRGALVERIAGGDRYETAAGLAATAFPSASTVYIASGRSFPDALAGAALAGRDRAPVLLTEPASLPAPTRDELARLRPGRIVVLGGTVGVSAAVAQALAAYGPVERIAGADRYETAEKIAQRFPATDKVYVATGLRFEHAVVAAAAAGREGVPLLLSRDQCAPEPLRREVARRGNPELVVVGGTDVVSDHAAALVACIQVPVPAKPTSGRGHPASFRFMSHDPLFFRQHQPPARWNPCTPIRYVVDVSNVGTWVIADLEEALRRIRAATGLTFVRVGQYDHDDPGAAPAHDARIGWLTPQQEPMFAQGWLLGFGGPTWTASSTGDLVITGGSVSINTGTLRKLRRGGGSFDSHVALLMHELGHMVGLDHPDDRSQVMYRAQQSAQADGGWGLGDLHGLYRVSSAGGCLTVGRSSFAAAAAPVTVLRP